MNTLNYHMIILDEDEYYCPSSSYCEEGTLSNRIIKLVNSHCRLFKNTFIIRSDKDNKYWQEKICIMRQNKHKGFLVITIDIIDYQRIIGGSLVEGRWEWLKEERQLKFI